MPDRSSEPTWIAEKISQWLGAQPDMDLKVESAAAAVFHALLEDDYPAIARQELVRHWLSARNTSTDDEEARLAYVLRAPGEFIAITEDFWSSAHNRGNAQRFLAKAFSAYRDDPRLNNVLTAAIARWMGFVHPAGPPLLRPNPGDEDRCRSEIRDRVGKELTLGPLELLGEKLTVIEDAGMLRLSKHNDLNTCVYLMLMYKAFGGYYSVFSTDQIAPPHNQ